MVPKTAMGWAKAFVMTAVMVAVIVRVPQVRKIVMGA